MNTETICIWCGLPESEKTTDFCITDKMKDELVDRDFVEKLNHHFQECKVHPNWPDAMIEERLKK